MTHIENLSTEERRSYALLAIERAKEAIALETNTHPSNWLTGKEAMELLGISRPTLIQGRKKGKYRYVHYNKSRYYYDKGRISEECLRDGGR